MKRKDRNRERVLLTKEEVLGKLQRELSLLKQYHQDAFVRGDVNKLGEVAGKLRLLVFQSLTPHGNKPLLLDLMIEYNINVVIPFDFPPRQMTLREYLDRLAFVIRVPKKGLVETKNITLVGIWGQQDGASHVDCKLDEAYYEAQRSGISIAGLPAISAALKAISTTVIFTAEEFLSKVDK